MQTYSCTPKAQNYRAHIATVISAVCLIIVSLLLIVGVGPLLLNQTLFVLFSAAVAYLIIRCFVTSYTYTVTLMRSSPVLIVTKNQGRRSTTVYHQELSALVELYEYGTEGAKNPRVLRVDSRYSFLNSMSPERRQILYFLLKDGLCVSVMLECDEPFLTVLREALLYIRSNPAPAASDDEEETCDETAPSAKD